MTRIAEVVCDACGQTVRVREGGSAGCDCRAWRFEQGTITAWVTLGAAEAREIRCRVWEDEGDDA